jgi:hypothetical protein
LPLILSRLVHAAYSVDSTRSTVSALLVVQLRRRGGRLARQRRAPHVASPNARKPVCDSDAPWSWPQTPGVKPKWRCRRTLTAERSSWRTCARGAAKHDASSERQLEPPREKHREAVTRSLAPSCAVSPAPFAAMRFDPFATAPRHRLDHRTHRLTMTSDFADQVLQPRDVGRAPACNTNAPLVLEHASFGILRAIHAASTRRRVHAADFDSWGSSPPGLLGVRCVRGRIQSEACGRTEDGGAESRLGFAQS